MRIVLLAMLFAGALGAQTYQAKRITNNYAAKTVYQTGVKLMANTSVAWGGDLDEGWADDYPIGFDFVFYGQTYNSVDITTNGWLSFKQLTGAAPTLPVDPPVQGPPASLNHNGIIAGCWVDLWGYVMSNDDGMFAQTVGVAPHREFRIDYHNMTKRQLPGGTAAFCIVLYETSNRIEIHYGNITAGTPFACGIENVAGTQGAASPDGWMLAAPATSAYAFTLDPELDIERGSAIANNGTDSVGTLTAGMPTSLNYTAFNRGDGVLNLGPGSTLNVLAQNNCALTVTTPLPASIAAGSTAVFTLQLTAAAPGAFDASFTVISDDADESPYTIYVVGTAVAPPTPEIEISRGGAIASGGSLDAGEIIVGSEGVITLRISNLGGASLQLTGAPPVQALNALNCSVSFDAQPPASLAPGAHTDVTLRVTPTGAGAFSFTLSVPSNDADENPYIVNVAGMGSTRLGGGAGGGGCTTGEGTGTLMLLAGVIVAFALALRPRRKAA